LLSWGTPWSTMNEPKTLSAKRDGNPIQFYGTIFKGDPGDAGSDQYLEIPPGGSVDMVTDMSQWYDMSTYGVYYTKSASLIKDYYVGPFLPANWTATGNENIHVESNAINITVKPSSRRFVSRSAVAFNRRPAAVYTGDGFITANLCNASEIAQIAAAVAEYRDLVEKMRYWTVGRESCGSSFSLLMQTSNGTSRRVHNFPRVWDAIRKYAENGTDFVFHCRPRPCRQGMYAYVEPDRANNVVYLCDMFFRSPGRGNLDTRSGVLAHEMSHFNRVAKTIDSRYGAPDAYYIATNEPEEAVANADNYEYFGEMLQYAAGFY